MGRPERVAARVLLRDDVGRAEFLTDVTQLTASLGVRLGIAYYALAAQGAGPLPLRLVDAVARDIEAARGRTLTPGDADALLGLLRQVRCSA